MANAIPSTVHVHPLGYTATGTPCAHSELPLCEHTGALTGCGTAHRCRSSRSLTAAYSIHAPVQDSVVH
eukprot:scaffold148620_cov22-Tisochrysis_lutea.AAC.1